MKHKATLVGSSLTPAPHLMAHYVMVSAVDVILLLTDVKRMLN